MKGCTYRYFSGEPLYPFGDGLSYATFAFNNLRFAKDVLSANDDLGASVAVTDTGKTAGDVMVQISFASRGRRRVGPIFGGKAASELESGRKQNDVDSGSESPT